MKLNVLNSGSRGNCYIIQDEEEALILEAGVSISRVKQELGFNTAKVSGCLITHSHGDHCAKASDFERAFKVHTHKDVINAKALTLSKEFSSLKAFMVGNFKVLPFPVSHDVPCYGFVISHKKIGNLLFITDSSRCDYIFPNINHMLIECNYSQEVLRESVKNGLHKSVADRVVKTHMELRMCETIISECGVAKTYNIVLLHLSSKNSDPDYFCNYIKEKTGVRTEIAKQGLVIELENNPY